MGRVRISAEPLSGLQRLLDAARQRDIDDLRAILGCTFTFDAGYFEQVLDALASLNPDGAEHLRQIPIDVVCDCRHYRTHSGRYNVHLWNGSNLFHPKLLMLLYRDRVVWLEGSQNMTRAGYAVNRELVSFHETANSKLPVGVYRLVEELAKARVAAASRILSATTRARVDKQNRSLTSLDQPLLAGLLGRIRDAREVYLVAPFFDKREQAGPGIESSVLKALKDRYPTAAFRVYLPQVICPYGEKALEAARGVFAGVFGPNVPLARLGFCGVPSDPRPLHAKLVAVRHGPRQGSVTLLTGSPNVTEAALLKRGASSNVELARELTIRWADFEKLLKPLKGRFRSLKDCRFLPPETMQTSGWHALQSATYDPLQMVLTVQWRRPEREKDTQILYAGTPVRIRADGTCRPFALGASDLRLETVCRSDPERRSWCPIVIPLESRLALGSMPDSADLPPEWWLARLGSLPPVGQQAVVSRGGQSEAGSASTAGFPLALRVRELAARMRYVAGVLERPSRDDGGRLKAHLGLLSKIFETHDPDTADNPQEQAWRLWVRLEIGQVLDGVKERTMSAALRTLRSRLKRQTATMSAPGPLERQWQALAEIR